MSAELRLAAGKIPLCVFMATQVALEAGAAVKLSIPSLLAGTYSGCGKDPRRATVEAFVDKDKRPEAVAILKAAGFRWAGNHYEWREPR